MKKHLATNHRAGGLYADYRYGRRGRRTLLSTTALTTGRISLVLVLAGFLWLQDAEANPKGGQVTGGAATISQTSPNRLDIHQTSDKAIINWQSFSIGQAEHTNFAQPSSGSVTLNRVVGGDLSTIAGRLSANGNIVLVNPNGILFTRSAQVDVHGLIASTADIADRDFMDGRFDFSAASDPSSFVINHGSITAAEGGLVALVAPWVENAGFIAARLGRVELASGGISTVDLYGDQLIQLAVPEADAGAGSIPAALSDPARVSNTGAISADGGVVAMTVADAQQIVSNVINMDGVVEARSVQQVAGRILLNGGSNGIVAVNGSLDASGRDAGEAGGQIAVLGEKVGLFDGAVVDVSGDLGGGTALIGGNFQGSGPEPNAKASYVAEGARVHADALREGKGGTAIVWADEGTRFEGTITARGGPDGGDGGFVEVSGKENLAFWGNVDVGAPVGEAGTLLLDPNNIRIIGDDFSVGVIGDGSEADPFTTESDDSVLGIAFLFFALEEGNVFVRTGAEGGNLNEGDISIETKIVAPEGGGDLTLTAYDDIIFRNSLFNPDDFGAIDFSGENGRIMLHADAIVPNGKGAIVNDSSAQSVILLGAGGAELTAGSGIGTIIDSITIGNSGSIAAETSGGSIFITSNDDLVIGSVGETAGLTSAFEVSVVTPNIVSLETITAQTGGVALVADNLDVFEISAGQDVSIVASGIASLGPVTASSGEVTIVADVVDVSKVSAGQDVSVAAAGFASLGPVSAQTGQVAISGASLDVSEVSADQDVSIEAIGAASLGPVAARVGGVTLVGASLDASAIAAGQDVSIDILGLASLGPVTAQAGGITLVGANLDVSEITAGQDVSIDALGLASLGPVTAQAGEVTIVATNVEATEISAGQSVSIVGSDGIVLQGSNYDSTLDFSVVGNTVLQNDVSVETVMGGVNFSGSIDGPWDLSLTAGFNDEGGTFVTITDNVGSKTPLQSLFARGDQVRLRNVTTLGDQVYDPRQRSSSIGFTTLGGDYVTDGGNFTDMGFTRFVADSSIMTSGGDITFGGIVNGFSSEGGTVNPDLTLVSGDGVVSFQGLVGDDVALGEVDATGSSRLNVKADEETTALLIDDFRLLGDDPLPEGFNVELLLPEFVPEPSGVPDGDPRPDPDPNRINPRVQIPRYDEPARLVDASPVAEAQNPLVALSTLGALSDIAPGAGPGKRV